MACAWAGWRYRTGTATPAMSPRAGKARRWPGSRPRWTPAVRRRTRPSCSTKACPRAWPCAWPAACGSSRVAWPATATTSPRTWPHACASAIRRTWPPASRRATCAAPSGWKYRRRDTRHDRAAAARPIESRKELPVSQSYPDLIDDLNAAIAKLRAGAPGPMRAFSGLAREALTPGTLDVKTKELLAIGIAIAVRCDGCIGFHVKAALRAGASREEVLEAAAMAIYMGAGPSMIYAAETLRAFDEISAATPAATA